MKQREKGVGEWGNVKSIKRFPVKGSLHPAREYRNAKCSPIRRDYYLDESLLYCARCIGRRTFDFPANAHVYRRRKLRANKRIAICIFFFLLFFVIRRQFRFCHFPRRSINLLSSVPRRRGSPKDRDGNGGLPIWRRKKFNYTRYQGVFRCKQLSTSLCCRSTVSQVCFLAKFFHERGIIRDATFAWSLGRD